MTTVEKTKSLLKELKMNYISETLGDCITKSSAKELPYEAFLKELLQYEIRCRDKNKFEKRMKMASFPEYKSLDEFDISEQQSLSQKQLNQLSELTWIEQGYNLVLLGPPGVGKTHITLALGITAVERGYKVYFVQMNDLIHLLKTQEITRTSRNKIKRMIESDLLIIDDLMFMAMDKNEANMFFQLINKLYGQTSIIITSNKGPEDWGELLGDPAITTAILDRLIHRCEVIHLDGDSYRIKHRESIFGNN